MESKIKMMRDFISSCPFIEEFTNNAHIDFTDEKPGNYGIMPTGEAVIRTDTDILGNRRLLKQYNCSLYCLRCTINDVERLESCGFIERFTTWIEDQSYLGNTPIFGDDPEEEIMSAQNGSLFQLSENKLTGRYQIQINVRYLKKYENEKE